MQLFMNFVLNTKLSDFFPPSFATNFFMVQTKRFRQMRQSTHESNANLTSQIEQQVDDNSSFFSFSSLQLKGKLFEKKN